jgi:hypothetical protein
MASGRERVSSSFTTTVVDLDRAAVLGRPAFAAARSAITGLIRGSSGIGSSTIVHLAAQRMCRLEVWAGRDHRRWGSS